MATFQEYPDKAQRVMEMLLKHAEETAELLENRYAKSLMRRAFKQIHKAAEADAE